MRNVGVQNPEKWEPGGVAQTWKKLGPQGLGPEGWGPAAWGPEAWGLEAWGLEGWGLEISRCFFFSLSRSHFRSCSLSWGLSLNFGGV